MSLTPSPSDPQDSDGRAAPLPLRTRIIIALVLTAAALTSRFRGLSQVQVEHFDEGVYASNLWFGEYQEGRYPDRHLYAPPLLPKLSELCQLLISRESWGAMLPTLLMGVAAVALMYQLCRDWFKGRGGYAATFIVSVIVAIDPIHVTYSRSLMTDVPMTTCLIGSVWLGWRGLSDKSFGYSIAAGVVCGIGWSFKYSGWLPLAIVGSALAARTVFHMKRFGPPWRELACWGAMVAAAVVVWMPAWIDLQEEGRGGYAAVAANHARYFHGFDGWLDRATRQIANANWFESNGPYRASLFPVMFGFAAGLALTLLSVKDRGSGEPESRGRPGRGMLLLVCSIPVLAFGLLMFDRTFVVPVVVGSAILGVGFRVCETVTPTSKDELDIDRVYANWFLAAWLASMMLATPLYHPYPRLLLPLMFPIWLGIGAILERLIAWANFPKDESPNPGHIVAFRDQWLIVLVVVSIATVAIIPRPSEPPRWSRAIGEVRSGLCDATGPILNNADDLAPKGNVAYIAYTWAEPAVFYQLSRLGPRDAMFGPITDFGFVETSGEQSAVPILLVTGPHAERDPSFQAKWPAVRDRFELVGEFPYEPSDMVLLDEYAPSELAKLRERPTQVLKLYRLASHARSRAEKTPPKPAPPDS